MNEMDILEEWKKSIEQPRTTYLDPAIGHDMAVRTIHEIERLRKENEWKPIETAPNDGTPVLIFWQDRVQIAMKHGSCLWFTSAGDNPLNPTHWMPLPKPPSEEG